MKLAALAFLALPLWAEPLYTLYDCSGQESACNALFPGTAAAREDFVVGGRVVVDGIDLGPARLAPIPTDAPTFAAFYHRGPWVIGRQYCCDGDEDGYLVRWLIEDSAATLFVSELSADYPGISDVNSSGQIVGAGNSGSLHYYDFAPLRHALSNADIPSYLTYEDSPTEMTWGVDQMLRINNDGQALFTAQAPWWLPSETRLFLLSPIGAPAPGLHTPEPSTVLLFGCGLLVVCGAKRRYSANSYDIIT